MDLRPFKINHAFRVTSLVPFRAGLGTKGFRFFHKASESERRGLVSEEIRVKEEVRQAKAAGLALQSGWTRWESVEPRVLS